MDQKVEEGSRDTDRGREKKMGIGVNIIEWMQTYIQSNAESERKRVAVVVWRGREAMGQKG
jgi:hypothetical protein